MAKKRQKIESSPMEVGQAQAAFDLVLPQLEELSASELLAPRIDLQLAAALVHSVALRDVAPERRSALAKLATAGVLDFVVLDRLPTLALASWHIRRKQLEAIDASNSARLSEVVLREAQEIRARMLRVLSHFFDEHPTYGLRIAAIRTGTGYQDLANDLLALAEFYEESEVRDLISRDPVHYLAHDPKAAREYAQVIFEALGLTAAGEAARWTELAQRAWCLLSRDYESLRLAGQLAFRDVEDTDVSYPSLVAAIRSPASKVRPEPPLPPPPPSEPVSEDTAG